MSEIDWNHISKSIKWIACLRNTIKIVFYVRESWNIIIYRVNLVEYSIYMSNAVELPSEYILSPLLKKHCMYYLLKHCGLFLISRCLYLYSDSKTNIWFFSSKIYIYINISIASVFLINFPLLQLILITEYTLLFVTKFCSLSSKKSNWFLTLVCSNSDNISSPQIWNKPVQI